MRGLHVGEKLPARYAECMSRAAVSVVLAIQLFGCGARIAGDPAASGEDAAPSASVDAGSPDVEPPPSSPRVLVDDRTDGVTVLGMALSAKDVVWLRQTPPGSLDIVTVAKTGGPVARIASLKSFLTFAVDATRAYYFDDGSCCRLYGPLWSVPVAGGTPTKLLAHEESPSSLTVNAKGLFWFADGFSDGYLLVRADLDGRNRRVLLKGLTAPGRLAANDEHLFFTVTESPERLTIVRVDLEGHDRTTLATIPRSTTDVRMVVAAGRVGFSYDDPSGSNIAWVGAMGGATHLLKRSATAGIVGPQHLALDTTHAYFSFPPTSLERAPLTEEPRVATLVPRAISAVALAVDDTHLFWAEDSEPGARILALPK